MAPLEISTTKLQKEEESRLHEEENQSTQTRDTTEAKKSSCCHCCSTLQQRYIDEPLKGLFHSFGYYIGKNPWPFVIVPLVVTVFLSLGLRYFEIEKDTEYLVTPKDGIAKEERQIVQQYFSSYHSQEFLPNRNPVLDGFADVIVSFDEGNILTPSGLKVLIDIDTFITTLAFNVTDNKVDFSNLCGRWESSCIDRPILSLYQYNDTYADIKSPHYRRLYYPYHQHLFIGQSLGGVETTQDEYGDAYVESAKAVRLMYYVKYSSQQEMHEADQWFAQMIDALLEEFTNKTEGFQIYSGSTSSLARQFDEASEDIMPKFVIPLIILVMFSVGSCMMSDWVRSKPWLALLGVLSAFLALLSSFGLLSAVGTKAVPQVGLVPFLILGKQYVAMLT